MSCLQTSAVPVVGGIAKSMNLLLRGWCSPQVYLGVWHEQEVSVKLARQKPISLKAERQFQQHVAKLHALDHPNVVGFMGACCWKVGCCASCRGAAAQKNAPGSNLAVHGKGWCLPCSLPCSAIQCKEPSLAAYIACPE